MFKWSCICILTLTPCTLSISFYCQTLISVLPASQKSGFNLQLCFSKPLVKTKPANACLISELSLLCAFASVEPSASLHFPKLAKQAIFLNVCRVVNMFLEKKKSAGSCWSSRQIFNAVVSRHLHCAFLTEQYIKAKPFTFRTCYKLWLADPWSSDNTKYFISVDI